MSLIQEMGSHIPDQFFSDPSRKYLDPYGRTGDFAVYLYDRLRKFHSHEHIVNNQLFVLVNKKLFRKFLREKYGFINTYVGDLKHPDKTINHILNMKFDVVIGNPPYQKKVGASNTEPMWHHFVLKAFELCKPNGWVSLIHPNGWRNTKGRFKKVKDLLLSKRMVYLNMNDYETGNQTFNASTSFDYYIVNNSEYDNTLVKVCNSKNETAYINLHQFDFIPDSNIELFSKIVAGKDDERVEILHSESAYAHRAEWMSDKKTGKYKYPCVYTISKRNGIREYYSKRNDNGHFGKPKVMLSNGGASYPIIDSDGEYGLMEYSFAICDTKKNLPQIKRALESEKFSTLMESVTYLSHKYNRKIIETFRKDFWKEFI
jgi:hypothetical protein